MASGNLTNKSKSQLIEMIKSLSSENKVLKRSCKADGDCE